MGSALDEHLLPAFATFGEPTFVFPDVYHTSDYLGECEGGEEGVEGVEGSVGVPL